MDNLETYAALLSGGPHFQTPIADSIAARFLAIRRKFVSREGEYCYDGNRCKPENLGWRFAQFYGEPDTEEIILGKWDEHIEKTWHEAAASEHWYRHEKDWGEF